MEPIEDLLDICRGNVIQMKNEFHMLHSLILNLENIVIDLDPIQLRTTSSISKLKKKYWSSIDSKALSYDIVKLRSKYENSSISSSVDHSKPRLKPDRTLSLYIPNSNRMAMTVTSDDDDDDNSTLQNLTTSFDINQLLNDDSSMTLTTPQASIISSASSNIYIKNRKQRHSTPTKFKRNSLNINEKWYP